MAKIPGKSSTWEVHMKRAVALLVLASLALYPMAAQARIGGQEASGNVALPGPGPNGETTGGCWTGHARRAWIISQGTTGGPFGSMIEIDKATWGGKFKLEVTGGLQGTEDLDLTFYADPGKLDPTDPAMQAGIVESSAYLTREAGGEVGLVPPTATVALICLAVGTGANADWTYTATPPKKKKK